MSESAISIRGLSKSYRRFNSNFWRAASLLGFSAPEEQYDVFWPLDDINIEINRGDRVALIGRNGAGKTTLLRHVSGELTPTEGEIVVKGAVRALFGLGDGFHPEFSGTQNLNTALALNGVPWSEIPRYIDEIIEFTELEDFIERPLKEYSAGMYARLGFAVATCIRPEILIVDEILGAGDAYFIGKCQQRIRDLTSDGTTLLFVSHDMGAAQMMCDRGIWLHNGRVQADGPILPVGKSYQAHIRNEEEIRLRARNVAIGQKVMSAVESSQATLVRLIADGNKAPDVPCYVSAVRVRDSHLTLAEVDLSSFDSNGPIYPIIDSKRTNWSKSEDHLSRKCRAFGDFGGRFVHAPIVLNLPLQNTESAMLELEVAASSSDNILVEQYNNETNAYECIGKIAASATPFWQWASFALDGEDVADEQAAGSDANDAVAASTGEESFIEDVADVADARTASKPSSPVEAPAPRAHSPTKSTTASGVTGALITDFGFVDKEGAKRFTLISGEPVTSFIDVDVKGEVKEPIAVIVIYRPDGTCASQLISQRDGFSIGSLTGRAEIRLELNPLVIGPGDYQVSVALFRDLDPSVLPENRAYDMHDRAYAIKVLPPDLDPFPIGIVNQSGKWAVQRYDMQARRGMR